VNIPGAVALVTGGASGLGLGIATSLARHGAQVILADIDADRAACEAATLTGSGLRAHAAELDVSQRSSWLTVADKARRIGPVTILCNNAGVGGGRDPIDVYTDERWRWVNAVNVTGTLLGIQTFLPAMRCRGEPAHIVNTVSMLGIVATPNTVGYIATKFAAMGLCLDLRQELRGTHIGVSALCPGMVRTRIVETTAILAPGSRSPPDDSTVAAMNAVMSGGMNPRAVGERVARAIAQSEFYIFTHPEWRVLVEHHYQEMLDAFGDSAEPGHRDDVLAIAAAQPSGK
jgi:NAD(P)-dependent dehydrogenase (short-subunit alcohol dehydrogenase family)